MPLSISISFDLIRVRDGETVRQARIINFLRPPLMSRADFFAESLTGTSWSSSPCMTRVGTSNFLRSSVKSVSENALMLS